MSRRRFGVLTATVGLATGLVLGVAPVDPVAQATTASAATVTAMTATATLPADPPNIVLITADDMRADDLAFMPQTRRLLGRAGVTFTDAVSNYPLCCPARATLLTGQYSHNNGVKGNEYPNGGHRKFYESGAEQETLPLWLQRAGYRTGFIGKYLNYYGTEDPQQGSTGPRYIPPGWDDWQASVGKVFRYYCVLLNENGVLRRHAGEYQTDLYRKLGADLIGEYAGSDEPFFLWTSHLAPHLGVTPSADDYCQDGAGMPTPAAARHEGMFSGVDLPPSPALNEADMSDKGSYIRDRAEVDLARMALVHQGRLQALQALDEAVAGTVAALKERGILDETVLIFASDNGWLLGEHRLEKKILPYEESLRVPMLVRGPGFPAGVRRHQPVGLVDIPATSLALSGAVPTKMQDGVSLLELAEDPDLLARRVMPIEAGPAPGIQGRWNPAWLYQGVRSSRYSYVAWHMPDSEEEELYDLDQDPFQLESLGDTRSDELATIRRSYSLLKDCAGPTCVQELPDTVEDGVRRPRKGADDTAPTITDLRAPSGWVATARPSITYTAADATTRAGRLGYWCSHQALGCDASGESTYRLRTEGRHTWRLFVTDPAGNVASRYGGVGVDLRRPTVRTRAARHKVVERSRTGLSWRADDSASGVAAVDYRLRTAGLADRFTSWSPPRRLQSRRDPALGIDLPARHGTACVEVRARDVAGRRSAWGDRLCRSRALDAARLVSGPEWETVERADRYAGTDTGTTNRGASLTVSTTGGVALVRLVARTGPGMGRLRVDVGDRFLARVDLDRPSRGLTELLLPSPGGAGQVDVTVVSTDRPVWLDSVGVVRRPPG